jgi:hypothetical protein
MELQSVASPLTLMDGTQVNHALGTSWPHRGGIRGAQAIPVIALVPLYHKVRIPFETVNDGIGLFDFLLRTTRCPVGPLVWDIHLTTVSDLKSDIMHSMPAKSDLKHKALTRPMPRYIWRATALNGESPVLDLMFDATEIAQASLVIGAIPYDQELWEHITTISTVIESQIRPALSATSEVGPATFVLKLLEWFNTLP